MVVHCCHLNFDSMSRLSRLNLITNLFIIVKVVCNLSNHQRHLASLALIHFDIYEMNGLLTEGEQRYFMTMIDNVSRYFYVYLLKTEDRTLNCFKVYKDEIEN
jgi:hypothetical protein